MTPKAASEHPKATTGPNVNSHTTAIPAKHNPSTATALRLDMCPRHARQAQYATHGIMAKRIAIHANLLGPSLKAPETSRIIAISPNAPVVMPRASLRMLFGICSPDLVLPWTAYRVWD